MKAEAQRTAIAEACPELMKGGYYANGIPLRHIGGDRFEPFDPLNDLNAMHEAEKTLTGDCSEYIHWLVRLAGAGWHATAAQRAEAFLRTIGKWVES